MADNVDADFERGVNLLNELDDPLTVFERHYQHLLTKNDALTLTRLLERATQTFVDDKRYKNDPRYLRMWLEYARRCREPEDIYAFLAMNGIASDLASYYEEYAVYLENKGDNKAGLILQAGVDRNAQPIERLKKKLLEYQERHPMVGRIVEVKAYKMELIRLGQTEASFEEVRARSWRRAGSILKASYMPPAPLPNNLLDDLEELDDGTTIDPDELTHISVYKDNTTDLREIAKSLMVSSHKENVPIHPTNAISFDQFIADEKPPKAVDNILDEFVLDRRNTRLSLIPEESDIATAVSGMIPTLLAQKVSILGKEDIMKRRDMLLRVFSSHTISSGEIIQGRIDTMNKSIGRDGQGNNHTVASIRIAIGHFFIEKKLADRVLLGVDLDADLTSSDLHQLALKIADFSWEPFLLHKLAKVNGIPSLGKVCCYPDAVLFTRGYYPHGTLVQFSGRSMANEKLVLFWIRELTVLLSRLHTEGVIHGMIKPEHSIVRLGTQLLSSPVFDPNGGGGWNDRGISLIGFSNSIVVDESMRDSLLDPTLHEIYRSSIDGQCPPSLCAIDLYGLSRMVESLLPPQSHRKYQPLWSRMETLIADSLSSPTWHSIAICYPQIIKMLDDALNVESVALPTLKSLLTKLEISLLERPS